MAKRRPPQEFIQDIAAADDGIRPFREAHDWAREKLGILASYLPAYATACKKAREFFFVDAMAGSGLYRIAETGEWLLGSTPLALSCQPAFTRCLSMELNEANCEALRMRVAMYAPRAVIVQGDCNRDLSTSMKAYIPADRPTFVLLDPEGAELEWQTVRGAAAHRTGPLKSELLVLFATEGLNRMLPVEADIELHNEMALNRLFPPESQWRDTWEQRRSGKIAPVEARQQYVAGYCSGLKALGYRYVEPREVTRPNGALVYHLVFATDHEAGQRIMADVFSRMYPNRQQLTLF